MKCPECHKTIPLAGFHLNESDNYGHSLPTGWCKDHKLYYCCHCSIHVVLLKDGSAYRYIDGAANNWEKIKVTVRKVPKSQIIGGHFVQ
jgi:hypothetical protein